MTAAFTEENEIRLESCTHDSHYGQDFDKLLIFKYIIIPEYVWIFQKF